MADERPIYITGQTFGMVITGIISAALALNGFMWSNIQGLREGNLMLQGEIQTLNARVLPVDEAITRDMFVADFQRQDANLEQMRLAIKEDFNDQRTLVIGNTKLLLVVCAEAHIEGLDCTR